MYTNADIDRMLIEARSKKDTVLPEIEKVAKGADADVIRRAINRSDFVAEDFDRYDSDVCEKFLTLMEQIGITGFDICTKVRSSQLSKQLKDLLSFNPGEMVFIEYGEMSPEEITALEKEVSNYPVLEDVVRFYEDDCDITIYMEAYDRVDWEKNE